MQEEVLHLLCIRGADVLAKNKVYLFLIKWKVDVLFRQKLSLQISCDSFDTSLSSASYSIYLTVKADGTRGGKRTRKQPLSRIWSTTFYWHILDKLS
jgi:hypothetical protein